MVWTDFDGGGQEQISMEDVLGKAVILAGDKKASFSSRARSIICNLLLITNTNTDYFLSLNKPVPITIILKILIYQ